MSQINWLLVLGIFLAPEIAAVLWITCLIILKKVAGSKETGDEMSRKV